MSPRVRCYVLPLSLIHISEPTRPERISYAVFCLKKKKKTHFLVFFHQTEFSVKCSGVFQKEGIFRWCPLCFAVKAACEGIASTLSVIPVTMGTRCFHKKIEFQRTRQKISVPLGTSTNLRKKVSNFSKTPGTKIPGHLRKTQPNVCSKRRDSESWTDIDGQNQRLHHEI